MQFVDMSLEDIIKQCVEDTEKWFPNKISQDLGYLTICMIGETGEFANLIKKGIRGTHDLGDEDYMRDLAMELTDVFIYVCVLAGTLGLDLEKMYQIKRDINNERFGNDNTTGTAEQ